MLKLYSWRSASTWNDACVPILVLEAENATHDLDAHVDRIDMPNAGFYWVQNNANDLDLREGQYWTFTIADTGLVFWDMRRFKAMKTLDLTMKAVGIVTSCGYRRGEGIWKAPELSNEKLCAEVVVEAFQRLHTNLMRCGRPPLVCPVCSFFLAPYLPCYILMSLTV